MTVQSAPPGDAKSLVDEGRCVAVQRFPLEEGGPEDVHGEHQYESDEETADVERERAANVATENLHAV